MERTITSNDAAGRLGVSRESVVYHCRKNGVGKKIGRDWMLSEKDIEAIRSRMGRVGRPRKTESENKEV